MYTKQQKEIINYTEERVKRFFKENPAPAHEFDHSERVRKWAVIIAKAEKANIFLCELAALVHDIGRAIEPNHPGVRHQELSYRLLRVWLATDHVFMQLSKQEKINLLYSVRYHWNNAATKYFEAVVLRDADKLDTFGAIGIKRTYESFKGDMAAIMHDFRIRYDIYYWIVTKTAHQLVKKYKMMAAIDKHYLKLLKKGITPVEL